MEDSCWRVGILFVCVVDARTVSHLILSSLLDFLLHLAKACECVVHVFHLRFTTNIRSQQSIKTI
jgi:uncharacterized membrane protein YwaF